MARRVRQGDHICALYETEEEQLTIAAAFVAEGLRKGERCLYVPGTAALQRRFRIALDHAGIDAGHMARCRALLESTSADVHLAGGRFDSERMLRLLNDAVEEALNAGFQGLRTCGDMSWLLGDPEGSDRVVEYEALLNQFFQNTRAVGMCLYDRAKLPPALIDHAIATHTSVCLDGHHGVNPFYEQPAVAATRRPRPEALVRKIEVLRQQLP